MYSFMFISDCFYKYLTWSFKKSVLDKADIAIFFIYKELDLEINWFT